MLIRPLPSDYSFMFFSLSEIKLNEMNEFIDVINFDAL